MPESFGARLRQQREGKGIALAAIAEQTKIKRSLLEELERDNVSHWPTGIFRRAYIRAYAHAIGLNPDVVLHEFLEVHPDPPEVVETLSAIVSAATGVPVSEKAPTRFRQVLDSAIGSLSRLRRAPVLRDGPPADPGPAGVSGPPLSDLLAAAHASTAPGPAVAARPAVARAAAKEPPASEIDFSAVAHLCTEFGRVQTAREAQRLLQEAGTVLGAVGLIVWAWDDLFGELRPVLVHGYSDKVLAQLPAVKRDSDNATAAAFRSARTCAINGGDHASGALAVPLVTPGGVAGVLAIELQDRGEQRTSVRAAATIFAALIAQLVGGAQPSQA